MASKKAKHIQPDWWSKTSVGAILGVTLAFALSGIFAWAGPGGINAVNKTQFVMWMIAPLWVVFFSLVYLFRSGIQAIFCFCIANCFAYLCLGLLNGFFAA